MAAERGHMDLVRYLVDRGADINIKDKNGVLYSVVSHVCNCVLTGDKCGMILCLKLLHQICIALEAVILKLHTYIVRSRVGAHLSKL